MREVMLDVLAGLAVVGVMSLGLYVAAVITKTDMPRLLVGTLLLAGIGLLGRIVRGRS